MLDFDAIALQPRSIELLITRAKLAILSKSSI